MSKRATREAFGATLVQLADEGLDVVAVEADLSKSTTTATFADAYPERFFNAGIAEQNMINVAAGLAVAGKIAFTGSFAVFATGRAYDQVRNTVCYSELDVKLAPTHSGITVGPDGGSHQMLEDIALMRVLPGMRVLVPADYFAAGEALRLAAATPGPFYIRLGRAAIPAVYDESFSFELGKAYVVRQGSDVTLAACGVMVERALAAAELLAGDGVSAEVIDVATVKPIDAATIAVSAAKTGAVVACEEHSIIGGLGSAVAEVLGERAPVPFARVGVRDVFGTSGEPEELMAHFGLTAHHVAEAAREVLHRRS
ncbi:MAG: transketolase C-terminal domain-containing protein [Anaerosomatales bacterium]|nr:transketolase C-terminal domain-containing protein [Anaerosomatales bacterium]MDT8434426.1 transketolase C-terminal domain-containing protein [Anaerosomatales bacterium]